MLRESEFLYQTVSLSHLDKETKSQLPLLLLAISIGYICISVVKYVDCFDLVLARYVGSILKSHKQGEAQARMPEEGRGG